MNQSYAPLPSQIGIIPSYSTLIHIEQNNKAKWGTGSVIYMKEVVATEQPETENSTEDTMARFQAMKFQREIPFGRTASGSIDAETRAKSTFLEKLHLIWWRGDVVL